MPHPEKSFIRWFADLGLTDRPAVGGKGASLGELARAGIRVPPGLVVTTAAFEAMLAGIDPDGGIRTAIAALDPGDLATLQTKCAAVRARIEKAPLPTEVHAAVVSAYQRLGGDDPDAAVAIRSSATSEDSDSASFAGLQDTYLWIRGANAVVRFVRSCWASLYSTESVSYRLRLGLPEGNIAMGVVIQRMVNARCAGVMFTRSPTTGDRSVIAIEGSWGLGSSLVSGEVTPDRFVLSKVTGEITHRTISRKLVEHVADTAGGTVERPVAEDRVAAPCLTDGQLGALARIAKQVERHYGAPQDIEWAIDPDELKDEGVLLLQSRPETVWASRVPQPVAVPKSRAFDHVFTLLGGRNR